MKSDSIPDFDKTPEPSPKVIQAIQQFLLDRDEKQNVVVQIIVNNACNSQHILKLTRQQIDNLNELLIMIKSGAPL